MYKRQDYAFVITENNVLNPTSLPGIGLERLRDHIVIAYTSFDKFVLQPADDSKEELETYRNRLSAVCGLLTFILQHMDDFGYSRISDVQLQHIEIYKRTCSNTEAAYINDFVCAMTAGHQFINIDIDALS